MTMEWKQPGCRNVCRPARTNPRTFDPKSVARAARYALRADYSAGEICRELEFLDCCPPCTAQTIEQITEALELSTRVGGRLSLIQDVFDVLSVLLDESAQFLEQQPVNPTVEQFFPDLLANLLGGWRRYLRQIPQAYRAIRSLLSLRRIIKTAGGLEILLEFLRALTALLRLVNNLLTLYRDGCERKQTGA